MIFWRNNISFVFSNGPWFKFIDYYSYKHLFLRYSNDNKSVKVNEFDDDYHYFESLLNGHRITAATDVTLNKKTFVYLFAGRMLCRQELSEQLVEVCNIEDIADWIDCSEIEETPKTPELPNVDGVLLFAIVLTFAVIIVLIIVIVVILCLNKRRDVKESPATIRSYITSPKPSESK